MKNKLLRKTLLTAYVSGSAFFAVGAASGLMAVKEAKLAKENQNNKEVVANYPSIYLLCVMAVIFSTILGGISTIYIPYSARKKTSELTREYLQSVFANHPEIKQYKSVFDDPQKIQKIATFICNKLSQEEREQISRIVKNSCDPKMAERTILNVVKRHAYEDPDFVKDVIHFITTNGRVCTCLTKEKTR